MNTKIKIRTMLLFFLVATIFVVSSYAVYSQSCTCVGHGGSVCGTAEGCSTTEPEYRDPCGNCGQERRDCEGGLWSEWYCWNEGTCAPGTEQCVGNATPGCNTLQPATKCEEGSPILSAGGGFNPSECIDFCRLVPGTTCCEFRETIGTPSSGDYLDDVCIARVAATTEIRSCATASSVVATQGGLTQGGCDSFCQTTSGATCCEFIPGIGDPTSDDYIDSICNARDDGNVTMASTCGTVYTNNVTYRSCNAACEWDYNGNDIDNDRVDEQCGDGNFCDIVPTHTEANTNPNCEILMHRECNEVSEVIFREIHGLTETEPILGSELTGQVVTNSSGTFYFACPLDESDTAFCHPYSCVYDGTCYANGTPSISDRDGDLINELCLIDAEQLIGGHLWNHYAGSTFPFSDCIDGGSITFYPDETTFTDCIEGGVTHTDTGTWWVVDEDAFVRFDNWYTGTTYVFNVHRYKDETVAIQVSP